MESHRCILVSVSSGSESSAFAVKFDVPFELAGFSDGRIINGTYMKESV